MSVWRPKTIFNPTKWANPGLGLSKRGKNNTLKFWGNKPSVVPADKTSVVPAGREISDGDASVRDG